MLTKNNDFSYFIKFKNIICSELKLFEISNLSIHNNIFNNVHQYCITDVKVSQNYSQHSTVYDRHVKKKSNRL